MPLPEPMMTQFTYAYMRHSASVSEDLYPPTLSSNYDPIFQLHFDTNLANLAVTMDMVHVVKKIKVRPLSYPTYGSLIWSEDF